MSSGPTWLSTEQAGATVGMSSQWVRKQIAAGRLVATVFRTGERSTFRIRRRDWAAFLAIYAMQTDDPDWE